MQNTKLYALAQRVSTMDEGLIFEIVFNDKLIHKKIIQLNTVDQLRTKHIDSNGDFLYSKKHESGVYSKTTEIISKGRKIAGTRYTLFDTGDFFNSWEVKADKVSITITADPIKPGNPFGGTNLFEEYGEDIVGLTDESKEKLKEMAIIKYLEYWNANILR